MNKLLEIEKDTPPISLDSSLVGNSEYDDENEKRNSAKKRKREKSIKGDSLSNVISKASETFSQDNDELQK